MLRNNKGTQDLSCYYCDSYICQVVPLPGSADSPVFSLSAQSRHSCHFGPNFQHVRRRDVFHDLPRPPPDTEGWERDSMPWGWILLQRPKERKVGGTALSQSQIKDKNQWSKTHSITQPNTDSTYSAATENLVTLRDELISTHVLKKETRFLHTLQNEDERDGGRKQAG